MTIEWFLTLPFCAKILLTVLYCVPIPIIHGWFTGRLYGRAHPLEKSLSEILALFWLFVIPGTLAYHLVKEGAQAIIKGIRKLILLLKQKGQELARSQK